MASELFDEDSASSSVNSIAVENHSGKAGSKRKSAAPHAAENPVLSGESSTEPTGATPLMSAPTSPATYATPPLPDRIAEARSGQAAPNIFAGEGLTFPRYFTKAGQDVFSTTEWEYRTAAISGERGEVVFEQKNCEIPKAWSMLATNVVVSKYFRGKVGTPQRENSVRQLVSRVADTIYKWGKQGNYFATEEDATTFHDELKYLLLHQYMAFNSPVWFNLGVPGERPQSSACFINSVDDTMESILTLAKTEGMLFKWGSGTGTNLSVLRSSKEGLKGGGTASGPVSFMRGFDAFAGAIKCLTPDTYIYTDTGLRTLGEIISPDLPPGLHEDQSVVVATKDAPTRISHVYVSPESETFRLRLAHTQLGLRGTSEHPVLVLTPQFRTEWRKLSDVHPGDRVAVARRMEMWPEAAPSFTDFVPNTRYAKKTLTYPDAMTPELARLLGYMVAEGCLDAERFRFCNADAEVFTDFLACVQAVFGVDPSGNVSERIHPKTQVVTYLFEACWTNAVRFLQHVGLTATKSREKQLPWSIRQSPRALVVAFLRAYFEGDGHVSRDIYAASASEKLLHEIQLLLLNMGMVSLLRPHPVNGKSYFSLYLRGEQAWQFAREIGFVSTRKQEAAERLGDKNSNTNIDLVPYLVDLLRSRTQKNGYFHCEDGQTHFIGFGFFNCQQGGGISYGRLRNTPDLVNKVRTIEPEWADTLEVLLQREFFWDTVESVQPDEAAVTYDFTVPGTHSFIAGGIVNHNSGGKCFRRGTLVATPEGAVPIETLQVGDLVLTHKGPRPVADFMPNGVKQCYKVRTVEGYELEVTTGHKFAFWDEQMGAFAVKPIEQFAPGEALYVLTEASEGGREIALSVPEVSSMGVGTTLSMTLPNVLDDRMGYVLGLMYGDGELRTTYPHRVRVAFCKDKAGQLSEDRFRRYCSDLFGDDPLTFTNATNYRQVGYTRKHLIEYLVANGIAKGKANALQFPTVLFEAKPEVRSAFVAGVIDADGTYQQRGGWSISMVDRPFLVELQRFLLTLGIPSKLRLNRKARGKWQNLYRLHIIGHTFVERLVARILPYSAKAVTNYIASPGADKGWGYRPSLLPALVTRLEKRGGYKLLERRVTTNETTGYGALVSVAQTHPQAAVAAYAAELSRCVQVTLESVTPTECDETYDIEVEGVHLLSANGIYASNTRRAAKMTILNADHPDIEEFIECKADAEKKAHALIEAGYSGAFNVANGAYDSVFFQNANHSVRATDDFMRAVELDRDWMTVEVTTGKPSKTYRARDLMQKISQAAWVCGDPGMQFDTTANRWHTCASTGRINASNPCVTGDTLVATTEGWQRIDSLVGGFAKVYGADGQPHFVAEIFPTGVKPVYRLRTRAGYNLRLTADHKVLTTNRGDVPAAELTVEDKVVLQGAGFGRRALGEQLAVAIGVAVGDGCLARTRVDANVQEIITLVMAETEAPIIEKIGSKVNELKIALKASGSVGRNDGASVHYNAQPGSVRLAFSSQPVVDLFKEFAILGEGSDGKRFTPAVYDLDKRSLAMVLRGLFTADGTVANYGEKSQYVALDSTSIDLLEQVQLLLLSFGIKAKIYRERRNGIFESDLPDGRGGMKTYAVKEMHSLRISRSSRFIFEQEIGFDPLSDKATELAELNRQVGAYRDTLTDAVETLELMGEEPVYDLTEPVTSHFVANGMVVHNCSEFFFLDDTACNLASLNLMRFRTSNYDFDIPLFEHAVRVTITAMEILVGNSAYPTDKITINSFDYRPLGLGYANLGALLMARGLPYDSDEGRAYAAAITAIMSSVAYQESAKMARRVGPFAGYERNRQPMLRVMQMHRDHVEEIPSKDTCPPEMIEAARNGWDKALELGKEHGYRNSQISVLAPTGTIGFLMDCDTTGVEPDIAIVKFKSLVGGGFFKIVNQTVPEALERLGYSASERKAILDYIEQNDTIEGAPYLADEHLPVFDCAFRAKNGKRTIHYMGHIKMMSAVQPFLSGAISKCVTGETLIFTNKGILPIGSLYEGEKPGEFRPCSTTLASIDTPQNADLFYYGGVQPTVKLTLTDGRTIEGTLQHRVKVANAQGYDWKRLSEITEEDYVAVRLGAEMWANEDADLSHFVPAKPYGCQKVVHLPHRMSPELARFFGWYIAEGSISRSNWTVRITNNNPAVLEGCQKILCEQFGLDGKIVTDARNGVTSIVVASKTLVEWLEFVGCGGDSAKKEIPWSVLQSRRESIQAFVGGLWLDGYVRQDGMVAICLNSPTLISQLQTVLNNFGLRPQIIRKWNKQYAKHFTELGLHGENVRRFTTLFTFDDPHKTGRLQAVCDRDKKVNAVYSDVVPCFRQLVQAAILQAHESQTWRSVFDKRTKHLSWETMRAVYERFGLTQLGEIVENNIHFVRVRSIDSGLTEVYDFQVPTNHAFLGNSIVNHNTVNMPHDATPDDISEAYMQAWKLGVKALAIYRDGSKKTQPLSTGKADDKPEVKKEIEYRPMRRKLPDERQSLTHKFSVGGHEGYLTVGLYPDGTPGEIFITMSKEGSVVSGLMDSFATSISLALQYGVPLRTLVEKFMHSRFEPSGFTGNPDIPMAKSIMDYLFRYLALKFLDRVERSNVGLLADQQDGYDNASFGETKPPLASDFATAPVGKPGPAGPQGTPAKVSSPTLAAEKQVFVTQADAPPCTVCGTITIRNGACYRCPNCGTSLGCS